MWNWRTHTDTVTRTEIKITPKKKNIEFTKLASYLKPRATQTEQTLWSWTVRPTACPLKHRILTIQSLHFRPKENTTDKPT